MSTFEKEITDNENVNSLFCKFNIKFIDFLRENKTITMFIARLIRHFMTILILHKPSFCNISGIFFSFNNNLTELK